MRGYRGPNSHNRQGGLQVRPAPSSGRSNWRGSRTELKKSQATWKVIAADMPIGLLVGDGKDAQGRDRFEAVANGDGPPLGREFEFADLFSTIKRRKIRNTCG